MHKLALRGSDRVAWALANSVALSGRYGVVTIRRWARSGAALQYALAATSKRPWHGI